MDFSSMKACVLDLIGEENYDRFDETFVGRAINFGCVDFLDKTEVAETNWTRSTGANQMWYKIPTGNYEVWRIEWYDLSNTEWHKLERKTFEEMDEEYPYDTSRSEEDTSWQQITGDPVAWIPREFDVYGIYPACDVAGDTLKFYGKEKHTDMSADASESEIPVVYQVVPCIYAARMLLRSDNDEKAGSFERWYKEEVMLAKKQIKERKKKMPSRWRMYTY